MSSWSSSPAAMEFADELWNEVALLTGVRQEPATEVDPEKAAQWLANSSLLVSRALGASPVHRRLPGGRRRADQS
jgi:hypothetical protein